MCMKGYAWGTWVRDVGVSMLISYPFRKFPRKQCKYKVNFRVVITLNKINLILIKRFCILRNVYLWFYLI